MIKVKVTVAKKENPFMLNNLSFILSNDARRHSLWVAYMKRQLGIANQVFVIKVRITVAKHKK